MNETALMLLVAVVALAGLATGFWIALVVVAREIERGASSVVGVAQAQLEASRRLHSALNDELGTSSEASEAREAFQKASGSPQIAASALREGAPSASAYGAPEAAKTPGTAVFGPYRAKRPPCRFCAQLRGLLSLK